MHWVASRLAAAGPYKNEYVVKYGKVKRAQGPKAVTMGLSSSGTQLRMLLGTASQSCFTKQGHKPQTA